MCEYDACGSGTPAPGTNKCTSGNCDDSDDLVISQSTQLFLNCRSQWDCFYSTAKKYICGRIRPLDLTIHCEDGDGDETEITNAPTKERELPQRRGKTCVISLNYAGAGEEVSG